MRQESGSVMRTDTRLLCPRLTTETMEMTKAKRETTPARLSLLHFTAETARNPMLHLWEEAHMLRATKCHLQREQGESPPLQVG